MFYGTECVHCHRMMPLVDKLEKETGSMIRKIEVWHNAKNAKLLEEKDTINCGGVPFFFNENTKKVICGAVPYETLKRWALGK